MVRIGLLNKVPETVLKNHFRCSGRLLNCFSRYNFKFQPFLSTENEKRHCLTYRPFGKNAMNIINAIHCTTVYRDNQISFPEAGFVGRAQLIDRYDLNTIIVLQMIESGQTPI